MQTRKDDIIIQIGKQWVRVGTIGDKLPRKTIRSGALGVFNPEIPLHEYQIKVEEMLYSIFYSYLNTSCLNKSVIILERVFTDRRITESIAKVLFKKFKIEKMQFSLSCITPLYLTGRYSGVIISGGASTVEIMPVYESYPIIANFKNIPTGSQAMIKLIKDELMVKNQTVSQQIINKMTDQYVGDLRNNYSNMNLVMSESDQKVQLTFMKNKLKLQPANISYRNIFGNPDDEEYNIAYMMLEMLENMPIEMIEPLCSNIVFSGGIWRVKGMQTYFKKQVKKYIEKFTKLQKLRIQDKIKFVSWGFNPCETSWIGCSVGSSIKAVDALCLKRVDYEKFGFTEKIMEAYFLSN